MYIMSFFLKKNVILFLSRASKNVYALKEMTTNLDKFYIWNHGHLGISLIMENSETVWE